MKAFLKGFTPLALLFLLGVAAGNVDRLTAESLPKPRAALPADTYEPLDVDEFWEAVKRQEVTARQNVDPDQAELAQAIAFLASEGHRLGYLEGQQQAWVLCHEELDEALDQEELLDNEEAAETWAILPTR